MSQPFDIKTVKFFEREPYRHTMADLHQSTNQPRRPAEVSINEGPISTWPFKYTGTAPPETHDRQILQHDPTDAIAVYCSCGWWCSASFYMTELQEAGDACVAAHKEHVVIENNASFWLDKDGKPLMSGMACGPVPPYTEADWADDEPEADGD